MLGVGAPRPLKAHVRAYAAERIVIPFPVRALNLEQESAFATNGGACLRFDGEMPRDSGKENGS